MNNGPVSSDIACEASNRKIASLMSEILDAINREVGTAKGALFSAIDSCANLEKGSLSAAESLETIRRSIGDISLQAESSSRMIDKLVGNVGSAQDNAGKLEKTVEKISAVVDLIRKIAKQTNLLALNAKIEAARVGEAGRGFAVVANEVKDLANQTSELTEDIASQVSQIEAASHETIVFVRLIHMDVQGMDGRLRAIADSVRLQQTSAGDVVSSMEACTEALGGLRNAISRIQKGAAANFERTTEMRTRLGELEL